MQTRSLGLLGTMSIGIGGIIGGGIFATLGLAGAQARGATTISFLIGGVVALLTAYSYVQLSIAYPSKGGTVEFLNRAFGESLLAGSCNTLLVTSYVVLIAVYASAFGTYGAILFPEAVRPFWQSALTNAILILLALINFAGPGLVDRSEGLFNVSKLGVLTLFVVVGLFAPNLDLARLGPADWPGAADIIAGGMLVFISYEGFELIANASDRVKNPKAVLPRAYYGSVIGAMVFYFFIIVAAFGHLSFEALAAARDYSLAAAAREFMGRPGFILMAAGAMLATASAVNSDFFGASKLPVAMAEEGEFPKKYDREVWGRYPLGLALISGLSLLVVNLMNLHALSAAASAGFLMVFAMVNIAAAKLADKVSGRRWISTLAALCCLSALGVMIAQIARDPDHGKEIWFIAALAVLPFVYQIVYRRLKA
jgi:uncharacterized protein